MHELIQTIPFFIIGSWLGFILFRINKMEIQMIDLLQMVIADAKRDGELLKMVELLVNKEVARHE